MKVFTLESEMLVPTSLEETFALFEDARNLAKITPDWLHFQIVTTGLQMRKGTLIEYKLRWHVLPLTWKTIIEEYDPPHSFVDVALKSPYKLWRHRHTFRQTDKGTVVADRVEYALPLGFLGQVAHSLVVRKQLEEIFAYRQRAIRQLLSDGSQGHQL